MALIKCRNCGSDMSDKAKECPHCRTPIYSNSVAMSFKNWSNTVFTLGVIILVIMIIASIGMKNIYVFIGSLIVYGFFVATSLILSAVAEIVQKLQNIEDNTKK